MPPQEKSPITPDSHKEGGLSGFIYDAESPISKADQMVSFLKKKYPTKDPNEIVSNVKSAPVVPFHSQQRGIKPFDPSKYKPSGKDIAGNQGDI